VAISKFNSRFWFDGNINIENKKISNNSQNDRYLIPSLNAKSISIRQFRYFDKKNEIKIAQGSQNYKRVIESRYKILWRYQNPKGYNYTDEKDVLPNFGVYCIASDNKTEIIFLLSILSSNISNAILDGKLKNKNEKSFLLGLTAIKQYIRVPKITSKNEFVKKEIVAKTLEMIFLENVRLKSIVDFSSVTIQRFDSVDVIDGKLILRSNQKAYSLEIPEEYFALVKASIIFDEVTLQDLKNTIIFDVDRQRAIKNYVDDLIFALYFDVPLNKIGFNIANKIKTQCSENPYYSLLIAHLQKNI